MSFEGYFQVLCQNGHYTEEPYCYHCCTPEDHCPSCNPEWRCEVCQAPRGWINLVDDTNADEEGYVELKQVGEDAGDATYELPEGEVWLRGEPHL